MPLTLVPVVVDHVVEGPAQGCGRMRIGSGFLYVTVDYFSPDSLYWDTAGRARAGRLV